MNQEIFWEKEPATEWLSAYPIGNGRQGAMIFGGWEEERVQLNLDSLWYGGHVDRINPDARKNLATVRSLILNGKIKEAETLLQYAFSATPQSQRPYQPLGDLTITWHSPATPYTDYRRALSLSRGLVEESFSLAHSNIKKTYLASFPDQVIAIHITSDSEAFSCSMLLTRGRFYEHAGKLDESSIFLSGQAGADGVHFLTGVKAICPGGSVCVIGEHLIVEGAKELTLLIAGETSFYEEDPRAAVVARLNRACEKGFGQILDDHLTDYQSLYERVSFHLDGADARDLPMSERLKNHGDDPRLAESYFQFARYLMISASRPGSLPLNLQGIWNEEMEPAWDSKYTININTEMNYWPADSCNLSECAEPLFSLIQRIRESGTRTASEMYGCRGFTAHHNTDIWADTAPQDIYVPASYWVMSSAWLCTHIMTQYRHTRDKTFLANLFSCLEEAVLFYEDFLIEDRGEFVPCPSVSPENTYRIADQTEGCVCAGCTMDAEILTDLFSDYLEAAQILGISNAITEKAAHMVKHFPALKVGKYGQLMEWREDYDEVEPGHRHISHLYGLYPSHQINWEHTPDLMRAAAATIRRRLEHGGGYTGWSCAWIICMYARLCDGEHAYANIQKLFAESTAPNLMDTHPRRNGCVFQIDGNMGAAAGIAQMLVQSTPERISLLPALPKAWADGSVHGLCLECGGEIAISWKNGIVTDLSLKAVSCNIKARLVGGGLEQVVSLKQGEVFSYSNSNAPV